MPTWNMERGFLKWSPEIIYLLEHLLDWIHVSHFILLYSMAHWRHQQHQLSSPKRNKMSEFMCDACRFVQATGKPIEEHPLLVYLTALPFTPGDSIIFKTI